ncbi:M48 family metallopeptidase [Odoribacter lunatus]|uniref:M48 family metallopeptidase n=1 Tax=Odoribacter lunatus TaxID=2941335 RepID=UPI002041EA2B|nr:SprT family zinc-dependent metalloprotease [Odoribacter lunatus]
MEKIELEGVGEIRVRRGMNIKYLSIRMSPGRGVWVNVPCGVSGRQMIKFVEEKKEWIVRNLLKVKFYEKNTGVGLGIGAEIRTKLHALVISEGDCHQPSYKIEGEKITLWLPRGMAYEKIDFLAKNFLAEIYKKEARQLLPDKVKYYAEKYGFCFTHLSFRNNISNWGSCSHDDKISLNIKLMKLPDELIDYVILHELCHTVEKNHSERFWRLVKNVCPDYEIRRRELRAYNTRF